MTEAKVNKLLDQHTALVKAWQKARRLEVKPGAASLKAWRKLRKHEKMMQKEAKRLSRLAHHLDSVSW